MSSSNRSHLHIRLHHRSLRYIHNGRFVVLSTLKENGLTNMSLENEETCSVGYGSPDKENREEIGGELLGYSDHWAKD
ncbi:hypothetical protein GCK72_016987 [Caenorhabditis remanei]|uniref:Uncharacterized protein n=1 Tax=Caenorhabditis remanei TaxID=31234 RepID=A0A6A5G642_CAERE|nr:hypothetical protein GCK72_016987 [Caenorhabditis remanei]KAF1750437.1 hypothetical protein GCK72_016987 [Caenorhabditis remanei]